MSSCYCYAEITTKLQQTLYLILWYMQGNKHWEILLTKKSLQEVSEENLLAFTDNSDEETWKHGRKYKHQSLWSKCRGKRLSCVLIKRRTWPWSPHPDDNTERCQLWLWKEGGCYAVPDNPNSLPFPQLGIKVLSTTALSKPLSRWLNCCSHDTLFTSAKYFQWEDAASYQPKTWAVRY